MLDVIISEPHPKFAQQDCYALKKFVFDLLDTIGIVPVEPHDEHGNRVIQYCLDPITESVLLRSDEPKITEIGREVSTTIEPQQPGEVLSFCLRAVPSFKDDARKVVTADPKTWIAYQASKLGVDLISFHLRKKVQWCSKGNLHLLDTVYVGEFRVQDVALLSRALRNGVGRHKGFGYGFLQLFRE